ncbi:uncharacterized protein V1516DRAFT_665473 [Lipomyces oligophaga]|uniref:uncharacterized protein n=1 Tax=Lipomyces oligophaga TaxID=45792 RepID=UPI0034D00D5C
MAEDSQRLIFDPQWQDLGMLSFDQVYANLDTFLDTSPPESSTLSSSDSFMTPPVQHDDEIDGSFKISPIRSGITRSYSDPSGKRNNALPPAIAAWLSLDEAEQLADTFTDVLMQSFVDGSSAELLSMPNETSLLNVYPAVAKHVELTNRVEHVDSYQPTDNYIWQPSSQLLQPQLLPKLSQTEEHKQEYQQPIRDVSQQEKQKCQHQAQDYAVQIDPIEQENHGKPILSNSVLKKNNDHEENSFKTHSEARLQSTDSTKICSNIISQSRVVKTLSTGPDEPSVTYQMDSRLSDNTMKCPADTEPTTDSSYTPLSDGSEFADMTVDEPSPLNLPLPLTAAPPTTSVRRDRTYRQRHYSHGEIILEPVHRTPRRQIGRNRTYRCRHCSSMFTSSTEMRAHVESLPNTSLSQRPYKCPELDCDWNVIGFHRNNDCTRHYRQVHGVREFVCRWQGARECRTNRFVTAWLRNRHERTVHARERRVLQQQQLELLRSGEQLPRNIPIPGSLTGESIERADLLDFDFHDRDPELTDHEVSQQVVTPIVDEEEWKFMQAQRRAARDRARSQQAARTALAEADAANASIAQSKHKGQHLVLVLK